MVKNHLLKTGKKSVYIQRVTRSKCKPHSKMTCVFIVCIPRKQNTYLDLF